MKHLKTFAGILENYDPDALPTDPELLFYWTVFQAAEFFEDFSWKENSMIKGIAFTRETGQVLNTYEIKKYNHGVWEVDFNNITQENFTHLGGVMEFLNRGGKDLYYIKGWQEAEAKIWKKAIELRPELTLECPSRILDKLDKSSLGNVKNMGTFDI